jgi:predicted metal-dependent phosphoesterase TrpH
MHTTASDGKSGVDDRIEQAHRQDLDAIAITDHDCISEDLSEPTQRYDGLEVITGVEIKADIFETKVEILGYYVDANSDKLTELLEEVRGYREERNKRMTQNFIDETGIDTSYEDLKSSIDGQLGRPHFARLLVKEGVVDSVSEAFDKYLADSGPIYVPTERASTERVIGAIRGAGGVASLAHPGRIDTNRVPEMIDEMSEEGLSGIEVWYPYGELSQERASGFGVEDASRLAEEHGLVRTGGSDCHGEGSDKFRIGDVRVPRDSLESLRSLST